MVLIGEKAKAFIEEDSKLISPSYTRVYPLVGERGEGVYITDVDGNRFLDFTSGLAVTNTGHCHPLVVEAIINQAKKLLHLSGTDFYYPSQINLAKELLSLFNDGKDRKVFFSNSGTEAIEAAIKLSRYHTKRKGMIAFYGSFHGRTMGSLSLTASKRAQREGFFPFVPEVIHTPYPYCYRCSYKLKNPDCDIYCVKFIEDYILKSRISPEEVSSIFLEPVLGEGGYIIPPEGFIKGIYDLCKKYGILFIADEVQTGMGRTGRMFAFEHFNITPDIITLAKGIASGLPLGATISDSQIMNWQRGSHASTFGGNPISCEASIATIKILKDGLIDNARLMGEYLISELKKLMDRFEIIGDVRGLGLMIGIELVKDRENKEPAIKERDRIIEGCFNRGLLVIPCGISVLRLCPSLIINKEHCDKALTVIEESLREDI